MRVNLCKVVILFLVEFHTAAVVVLLWFHQRCHKATCFPVSMKKAFTVSDKSSYSHVGYVVPFFKKGVSALFSWEFGSEGSQSQAINFAIKNNAHLLCIYSV